MRLREVLALEGRSSPSRIMASELPGSPLLGERVAAAEPVPDRPTGHSDRPNPAMGGLPIQSDTNIRPMTKEIWVWEPWDVV